VSGTNFARSGRGTVTRGHATVMFHYVQGRGTQRRRE